MLPRTGVGCYESVDLTELREPFAVIVLFAQGELANRCPFPEIGFKSPLSKTMSCFGAALYTCCKQA